MGKFLLILLLCLSYHATASIILVPVSFSQANTSTVSPSTDTTVDTTTSTSEPVATSPSQITEPSAPTNLASNDQTSTESVTITQQPTNTVSNDPTNIEQDNSDTSTVAEPTEAQEITVRVEDNSEQSRAQQKSSESNSKKSKNKKQNSNINIPLVKINNPGRNRRQGYLGFDRSIVLMKQFPEKNALLSNSNINFVEKKFTLAKQGPFQLTFSTYVVPSQTTQPIDAITLVIDLNGSLTKVPLMNGQGTHAVTLNGEKGVNSLIFSLQGESKGLGLVSVVLNQFKMQ